MKFLCLFLVIGLSSPLLATLRLQELNRIGLTGKISDKLVALGQGDLLLPIVSALLVRQDSILLGSDEQRRIVGRLAVDPDYQTMRVAAAGMALRDAPSKLRTEIDMFVDNPGNKAALARILDHLSKLDQVSYPSRLNSIFLSKTAYAIYQRANGVLYMLMVNVVNDSLKAQNVIENLLIDFDHAVTTTNDIDEFIKKEALGRRGIYLAVAEIKNNHLKIHHVGLKIGEQFWSSVYPVVIRNNQIKPLVEEASFAYQAPAGNNFMLIRRQDFDLQEGDNLFLLTGVNDFESSEVMLTAPRALDKHVAENVNKLNYYLGVGNSSLGQIVRDNLLQIVDNGQEWWKHNNTQKLLEHIDSVNYTMLYYLHHPQTP